MLKIEFDNFKNGWIQFILKNDDFHFKNKLSTIETYNTPELFFKSVIQLIHKKETYIKLDQEGYQDYLFLAPTKNDTIYWLLCKPNGKDYNYIDYLKYSDSKIFTPYILDLMEEFDSDLTILNKGSTTIATFCLTIYDYFKRFSAKESLIEYKEKALTDFNIILFKEMESLILSKL